MPAKLKTALLGASGYSGLELARILERHPRLEKPALLRREGSDGAADLAEVFPELSGNGGYPLRALSWPELKRQGVELLFLATPHEASRALVPEAIAQGLRVIDLSGAWRLKEAQHRAIYSFRDEDAATAAELTEKAVYGLPELAGDRIASAQLVANPGCYATSVILALLPLLKAGLIDREHGIISDSKSGVSGAGRGLKESLHFGTVDEDFTAYGLLTHRHTPEMEQIIGGEVLFTPHLAPMTRGILATCYARPADGTALTTETVMAALHEAYDAEPFVVVTDAPPSTKATAGSNAAHVTARVDPRTGWVLSLCALDNLVKGASGQAIQCANAALGLPETTGLPIAGVYP